MHQIPRHRVREEAIAAALDDFPARMRGRWIDLRYDHATGARLQAVSGELLDHLAARSVQDPALRADPEFTHDVLRTAAEASLGAVDRGVFPKGDFEIPFPLMGDALTNVADDPEDNILFDTTGLAPGPQEWVEAFELGLTSGLVWEPMRVIGLVMRMDLAPDIRDGLPYSALEPRIEPAALAQMDALCLYLNDQHSHPRPPDSALRKPTPGERAAAARALDGAGALTPDQRLLRVLLEDDRQGFERALADHLVRHCAASGADDRAAPRTLLPMGAIALTALAVQIHGWRLGVTSDYLPGKLLR